MSCGFHKHPGFQLAAAADAEIGKPSMGAGALQCNLTYAANMGIEPRQIDLGKVVPQDLPESLGLSPNQKVSVLSVCPPCTGFSRANPENHLRDDHRNSLVSRAADFALALNADVVVMENARELLRGNFKDHFREFQSRLEGAGYAVAAKNYMLSKFGLPQIRERAIVIAAKQDYQLRTLDDLWANFQVEEAALTVRAAFAGISKSASGINDFPSMTDPTVRARMAAIPLDGGSWAELVRHPKAKELMTPSMKRIVKLEKLGSHPDVYGRMSWDKPAPTIKRECAHVGNGRYAHPSENRLCSVREMAMLQGFPNDFSFAGTALSNKYRHIGDAVPPLISFQLAHVCHWILTGRGKSLKEALLPGTHLKPESLVAAPQTELMFHA